MPDGIHRAIMVKIMERDRIMDQIKLTARAGQVLFLLMVLMALSIWPAASVASAGSAPASNSSLGKPSNCSWTGQWSTYFGNMTITQSGKVVTGTYEADGGRINGTVSGKKLVGNWSEGPSYAAPGQAGNIEFNLSEDCNSFGGRWRYGYEGNWSTNWSGTRVLAAKK